MGGFLDAVEHRVAHVDIGRGHVDPGAKAAAALGEFAGAHAREQVEVLLDASLAAGAIFSGFGQGAAVFADLVGRQVVDVGPPVLDQLHRPVVELLEVVGGVVEVLPPVEAEPADVAYDRLDVFRLFLGGIGVIEAQVAAAAVLQGDGEIETDRLGVADVQVAVRLGREAGDDAAVVLALFEVPGDDVADEIGSRSCVGVGHGGVCPVASGG